MVASIATAQKQKATRAAENPRRFIHADHRPQKQRDG